MIDPNDVLATLKAHHRERMAGVTAEALAVEVCGQAGPGAVRRLRAAVEALRLAGEPVCGTPQTGYYYSERPEDIWETIEFLRGRALTSLVQLKPLKRRMASARREQTTLFNL